MGINTYTFSYLSTNISSPSLYMNSFLHSNKSGIGGILKGLGLKGSKSNSSKFNDSDSDLQISSEHTSREYKSRNTFPTAIAPQKDNKKPPNRAGKFVCI